MTEVNEIMRFVPQKLLQGFSKGNVMRAIVAALILHVVIIGGFSVNFIYYHWLNPEAGEAREAAAKARAADAAPAASSRPDAAPAAKVPAGQDPAGTDDQTLLDERKDSAIVRQITESAQPGEIPTLPGEGGISFDDMPVD